MNPRFNEIGHTFVKTYYATFDADRSQLRELYRAGSMLTFEGQQLQGVEGIMKKLVSLPFKEVKHLMTTCDCQPTNNGGVVVFVVGQLKTDNDPPHSFSQTFVLAPADEEAVKFYVLNDLFRLQLHNAAS